MEKTTIKNTIIFFFGVLVGAAASYKIIKDKFEANYLSEVEEYRDYLRSSYEKMEVEESVPSIDDSADMVVFSKTSLEKPSNVGYHSLAKDYNRMANKQDIQTVLRERGLSVIQDAPPEDEEEDDEEDDLEDKPIIDIPLGEGIYIIPPIEYVEETTGNEKLSLTYYAGDDVLTDDNDVPIDDRDSIVGPGNLNKFGYRSHNPNMLYIRNQGKSADFEIIRLDESYRTSVLNYDAEEALVKPITKKRTKKVKKDEES